VPLVRLLASRNSGLTFTVIFLDEETNIKASPDMLLDSLGGIGLFLPFWAQQAEAKNSRPRHNANAKKRAKLLGEMLDPEILDKERQTEAKAFFSAC